MTTPSDDQVTAISDDGQGLTLDIQTVPRSSRERIGPIVGERLRVQITAPPVDGAANQALIELLARALGVPRRQVTIVRGDTGRKKTVRVDGARRAALEACLEKK